MADFVGLGGGHLLQFGFGGRVGTMPVEHLEFGAQPPHFARGVGDGLDRGIILGQAHKFVGRDDRRAPSPAASSCLRASIDAIRSDEMWVIGRSAAAN